jgi:hypothetical protein
VTGTLSQVQQHDSHKRLFFGPLYSSTMDSQKRLSFGLHFILQLWCLYQSSLVAKAISRHSVFLGISIHRCILSNIHLYFPLPCPTDSNLQFLYHCSASFTCAWPCRGLWTGSMQLEWRLPTGPCPSPVATPSLLLGQAL